MAVTSDLRILELVVIVLVVLWVMAVWVFPLGTNAPHLLLVFAIVLAILRLMQGRS